MACHLVPEEMDKLRSICCVQHRESVLHFASVSDEFCCRLRRQANPQGMLRRTRQRNTWMQHRKLLQTPAQELDHQDLRT